MLVLCQSPLDSDRKCSFPSSVSPDLALGGATGSADVEQPASVRAGLLHTAEFGRTVFAAGNAFLDARVTRLASLHFDPCESSMVAIR